MKPKLPRAPLPRQTGGAHRVTRDEQREAERLYELLQQDPVIDYQALAEKPEVKAWLLREARLLAATSHELYDVLMKCDHKFVNSLHWHCLKCGWEPS